MPKEPKGRTRQIALANLAYWKQGLNDENI